MSRFIDKLKLVARSASQPIGFQTARSASSQPPMLLIAGLPRATTVTDLTGYLSSVDAVLLSLPKTASGIKALSQLNQSFPDSPWGGWRKDHGEKEIERLTAAGCDFLVIPASSTIAVTGQNAETGMILQVESSLSEGLLRAVNELPVDAVLVTATDDEETALTWHHLMLFQRLANILTKPLLASVPANITATEVQVIWEAGVHGIVVTTTEQSLSRLKELRQATDNLKRLPRKKRGEVEAIIPSISGDTGTVEEDVEEEGE